MSVHRKLLDTRNDHDTALVLNLPLWVATPRRLATHLALKTGDIWRRTNDYSI